MLIHTRMRVHVRFGRSPNVLQEESVDAPRAFFVEASKQTPHVSAAVVSSVAGELPRRYIRNPAKEITSAASVAAVRKLALQPRPIACEASTRANRGSSTAS